MLIPLTRATVEQLLPLSATADQYRYYWGKFSDFLRRLLISVIGAVVIWVIEIVVQRYVFLALPLGIAFGLYWLWAPVMWATLRNRRYRKFPYGGFWRGEVLDVFLTEELIGTEETVNDRGELVIVENRERRINVEVGDESGFKSLIQAPLRREHQAIAPGQVAELLLLSNQPDLRRVDQVSDLYLPARRIWVSNYPCLQREAFVDVGRRLDDRDRREPPTRDRDQPPVRRSRSRSELDNVSDRPSVPRRKSKRSVPRLPEGQAPKRSRRPRSR